MWGSGKKDLENNERVKRYILLKKLQLVKKDGIQEKVFMIDTDTLDYTINSYEDVREGISSGEFSYETDRDRF